MPTVVYSTQLSPALLGAGLFAAFALIIIIYYIILWNGDSKQSREFRRYWRSKMKKSGVRKSREKYMGTTAGAGSSAMDKRQG